MPLTSRLATHGDVPSLMELIDAAIDELQKRFLDEAQIRSSHAIMGLDKQLIDDSGALSWPIKPERLPRSSCFMRCFDLATKNANLISGEPTSRDQQVTKSEIDRDVEELIQKVRDREPLNDD
jgi:hypothetical protein